MTTKLIANMEIENLKMKILGMKNEISYPLWSDFIDWIIEEFEYTDKGEVEELQIELKDSDDEKRDILKRLREIIIEFD